VKVAVIGTGYVGLPTGIVLADLGHQVICVDRDQEKVAKLRAGVSPIYEPGVEELLKKVLHVGRLTISDDIDASVRASEVVFIAVGTPPGPDGTPDLSYVMTVAREVAKSIDKPTLVVNKSTVPVGTADLVHQTLVEEGADPALFHVLSNPEFLREGAALWDTQNPDRIVIGHENQEAADKLVDLYRPLNAPFCVTNRHSAELIKYASNSYLAMKISFINAISRLCEQCEANVSDVAAGMGADKRIGPQFLAAGLGWGGSCFPKDVQGLIKVSEKLGYDFKLLQEVWDINEDQTHHFLKRIGQRIGGFAGKTVALLGLAFKPNTDDIRDAKSLVIIQSVLDQGGSIRAYDPIAEENVRRVFPGITYVDDVHTVGDGADVLILVTEWPEFKTIDLAQIGDRMAAKILFDGRRMFAKERAEAAGFEFYTVGS
jgi:UDPglucose 6-dehydrogenase